MACIVESYRLIHIDLNEGRIVAATEPLIDVPEIASTLVAGKHPTSTESNINPALTPAEAAALLSSPPASAAVHPVLFLRADGTLTSGA